MLYQKKEIFVDESETAPDIIPTTQEETYSLGAHTHTRAHRGNGFLNNESPDNAAVHMDGVSVI